jgi:IMP dehydrogenase
VKEIPLGLTFDDVLIVPHHSTIKSRNDVDISTWLTGNVPIYTPIVSSPMDTVTEWEMAQAMGLMGGFGFIHRYMSPDAQAAQCLKAGSNNGTCGAAVGLNDNERLHALLDAGVGTIVLDVAYGDNIHVLKEVERLAGKDFDVIAGNVVTPEGFANLVNAGASSVRVGIGGGSACSTRTTTGVGVPQLTAIINCAPIAKIMGAKLIADGGIRSGADIAKALAAGADSVMVGNLLAAANESPGMLMGDTENGMYKEFRGMASAEAQADKAELLDQEPTTTYIEGVSGYVKLAGTTKRIIEQLTNGVRSAFSYVGARDLEEFQNNAEFIRITQAGVIESSPHDMRIK